MSQQLLKDKIKSDLGVSPVSSIPYTITCIFGLEMGKATILFHIFLVIIQIFILRKEFKAKNLLQVVVGVLFGYFTTFSNYLFTYLPTPNNIFIRLILMIVSTLFIAVGTIIAAVLVGINLGIVTKLFGKQRDKLLRRLC